VPPLQPQPILEPLTPAAIFLVVTIDDGGEQIVHDALPDISGLLRAIGFREPPKRLSASASIVRAVGRRVGPANATHETEQISFDGSAGSLVTMLELSVGW